jgi:hypothetical protein
MCKSQVIKRVENAGGVLTRGGHGKSGIGRKKGKIFWSFCDFLVRLVFMVCELNSAQPSSCKTSRHLMTEKP